MRATQLNIATGKHFFFYCNTKDTYNKTRQKLLTIPLTTRNLYHLLFTTSLEYNSYTTLTVFFSFFDYKPMCDKKTQWNGNSSQKFWPILAKVSSFQENQEMVSFRKFKLEWISPFVFSAEYFSFWFLLFLANTVHHCVRHTVPPHCCGSH